MSAEQRAGLGLTGLSMLWWLTGGAVWLLHGEMPGTAQRLNNDSLQAVWDSESPDDTIVTCLLLVPRPCCLALELP